MDQELLRSKHIRYFQSLIKGLPEPYASLDSNRLMVLYFCCNALDIMGVLNTIDMHSSGTVKASSKPSITAGDDLGIDPAALIEWIYSMQVPSGGFVGGDFSGECSTHHHQHSKHDDEATALHISSSSSSSAQGKVTSSAHITMTYTAIATLVMLGDDLKRVNRDGIARFLKSLQNTENGCFRAVEFGGEEDTRFIFSAACIGFMLQDWRGINVPAAVKYILSTQSFDGGFGLYPGQEGHGGSTYCGIAALALFGELNFPHKAAVKHFLMTKQIGGFNGRTNKDPDSCYTFWVGASMQLLSFLEDADAKSSREFVMMCQHPKYGGFSKVPDTNPDILHAHFSVCGLSLLGEPGFNAIDGGLCITLRAFDYSPFAEGKTARGTKYSHPSVLCADLFSL